MNYKLSEIALINPKESLPSGSLAKKVAMEKLQPFCRDIDGFELTKYNGGTKFRNGDTIMARITPCLENGKIAKVNILDEKEIGFGSTEYIIFRAKPGVTDEDYLYYLITSPIVRNPAIKSMVGSSGRQRVQTDVIQNLEIDVPELPIQKKIGSILKRIDDKIELNRKINDNLLKQAFAIFESKFIDVCNGTHLVSDYILPKRGKGLLSKDAVKGNIPVVAGGLEPSTFHNVANTSAPVLTISASGANAGFIRLWNRPVWSSDSSFIDKNTSEYVYFWYVFLKKRQEEIYGSQTGSAQPHIYPYHIGALPCSELKINDIKSFNDDVTPLFMEIGNNESENLKLANLRDSLLPKLMSGEIDVDSIEL